SKEPRQRFPSCTAFLDALEGKAAPPPAPAPAAEVRPKSPTDPEVHLGAMTGTVVVPPVALDLVSDSVRATPVPPAAGTAQAAGRAAGAPARGGGGPGRAVRGPPDPPPVPVAAAVPVLRRRGGAAGGLRAGRAGVGPGGPRPRGAQHPLLRPGAVRGRPRPGERPVQPGPGLPGAGHRRAPLPQPQPAADGQRPPARPSRPQPAAGPGPGRPA